MEAVPRGLNGPAFTLCVVLIAALAIAQSVTHLVLILGSHRVGTMFDLDRSNGVPDLVSTVVLGAAAAAAEHGALRQQGMRRRAGRLLALALAGSPLRTLSTKERTRPRTTESSSSDWRA